MAIRINRVYTRGGDSGETSLVGGQRIAKDAIRIESYGTVDELNATLGLVRTANRDDTGAARKADRDRLDAVLEQIQNELFNLCLLYTSPSPRDRQKARMPSSA